MKPILWRKTVTLVTSPVCLNMSDFGSFSFCQVVNNGIVITIGSHEHIAICDKSIYLQTYRSQQHEICMVF